MKAWVLHDIGDLRFEEHEDPVPTPGHVVVSVRAAGICGSDIPRIFETGAHTHPLIPGHEFAGEVTETSDEDAKYLGKRVGVFPLIPCMECSNCRRRKYELCSNYNYLGSRCDGGYAQKVLVPTWNLIEVPEKVSFEAAAMIEPAAGAYHAIRQIPDFKHRLAPLDMPVCVWGLGTIGLLLAAILRGMGYNEIWCVGNKPSQKKRISELGIDEKYYVDCNDSESVSGLTSVGLAAVFECVGRKESYASVIDVAGSSADVVLVGNPRSDMDLPREIYWKILRKQLAVRGTWNSSFGSTDDDWRCVMAMMAEGSLRPEEFISHRFALKDMMDGLIVMRDRTEEYCKVMINDI